MRKFLKFLSQRIVIVTFLIFLQVNAVGQDGLPIPAERVKRRIGALLHFGVFAMKLANNSVVALVCESRLQLIMMPSEHQRIIWVLTNLLHKVGS